MSETPTARYRSHSPGIPDAELLAAVCRRAGITQYDVLVIGDGSGNAWGPCGWASVLVDRHTRGRRLFYGATECGSINFAETLPYLQALNWYDGPGNGKELLRQFGTLQVHIISDSQVICNWGTRAANPAVPLPRTHAPFWAGIRELGRLGYCINWHWAARSTSCLNWTADLIAGLARGQIKRLGANLGEGRISQQAADALAGVVFCDPSTGEPISLYHLNPDGPAG